MKSRSSTAPQAILKVMKKAASPSPASLMSLTKAELVARLQALPCAPRLSQEVCPAERLKLELGTHHVELETQNQELRASQLQIEEARDRYSDLYDFAPVGYVTLDKAGVIREINLTGAELLGCERSAVIGKPLLQWLDADYRTAFHKHIQRVFESRERVTDEMLLRGA